jgi:hypothetical protein
MKPRKLAILSAEDCGIPGHLASWSPFANSGIKSSWRADGLPDIALAQTRRQHGRRQGLTILAREVTDIAAQIVPKSQAKWLWDCTTPDTAPTGTFVSGGAIRFSRKIAAPESFFPQVTRCAAAALSVSHPYGQ